jgi:hypothetical protein
MAPRRPACRAARRVATDFLCDSNTLSGKISLHLTSTPEPK